MKYYAELDDGARVFIKDHMIYEALVRLHNWIHVIREPNVTVIKKG